MSEYSDTQATEAEKWRIAKFLKEMDSYDKSRRNSDGKGMQS